jgi:hypothetical protein
MTSAVVAAVVLLAPGARASQTPATFGSRLVTLINQARAQQGLAALRVAAGTSQVAQAWSQQIAAAGAISHNPDLQHQLETHGSPDWTAYGENVGTGSPDDPDAVFRAYMASAEHRANILNGAYRFIGVGVVFSGGAAYNTLDFVDSYTASTSTAPAPAPKPTASPAPAPRPAIRTPATTATTAAAAPARPAPVVRAPVRVFALAVHPHRAVPPPRLVTARPVPHSVRIIESDRASVNLAAPVAAAAIAPLRGGSLHERLPVALAALLVSFVASTWLQEVRHRRG